MALKDLPDWTRQVIIRYEGGFIGLEELAARLGSIVPWDLKGNVVLMEDFESALTEWISNCDDLGSTATRTSEHKYSGDWAVKLYNCGGAYAYTSLYRYLHFPGMTKYAAFARFCWKNDCRRIYLQVGLENETYYYTIEVDYDLPTTTLSIITTDGDYYEVDTDLSLYKSDYVWYPILVTFNLVTGYYDKLYFADREYDISTVPIYVMSGGGTNIGYVTVTGYLGNATPFTIFVDDIIIAKNVP